MTGIDLVPTLLSASYLTPKGIPSPYRTIIRSGGASQFLSTGGDPRDSQ